MKISKAAAGGVALLGAALALSARARAQGLGLDLSSAESPPPKAAPSRPAKKVEASKPPPLDFGLDLTSGDGLPKVPDAPPPALPLPPAAPEEREPLPAPPPPPPEAAQEPGPAPAPEYVDETFAPEPLRPRVEPVIVAVVGPGAVFRNLSAGSSAAQVPRTDGAMSGLGVDLAFFPARLSSRAAGRALSDLSLEAHYRRTFASAQLQGEAGEGSCAVDDDEILARAAYRYPLPGERLPRVGLSAGFTSERVLMRCSAPALSTRVRTLELHLTALEPILGERLQLQAAGGPRLVLSPHGDQAPARSYALELWITSHPLPWLFARGGIRFTATREQTEDGVGLAERRAFAGVEVGAAY